MGFEPWCPRFPALFFTTKYCTWLLFDSECKSKQSILRFLQTRQACSHSLAEANLAISLAATGECSSCQCLSASALLVVFPVACPYSSLFVTAFHSHRIVVCMYRVCVAKQSSRTVVNCLWEQVVDCRKYGLWGALLRVDQALQSHELLTRRGMFWICNFNQSWYLKFDAQEWHTRARTNT